MVWHHLNSHGGEDPWWIRIDKVPKKYFNPKKETQITQVFKEENTFQNGYEVWDEIRVLTFNNDIIDIDEKIGKSRATSTNK